MNSLPRGWTRSTLGEQGRYLNGRGFKKVEWRESGRPIIRIQNLTGSNENFNYFQGDVDGRHVVRPGDLLVSWAATLGAYLWSGPEAVLNQHIFKVESCIDKKFHKYLLDQKLAELMLHTHGSGMVHITRSRFDSVPVEIPPMSEQRRIVDLLEDHLSRLDAACSEVDRSLVKLRQLRIALLGEMIELARRHPDCIDSTVGEIAAVGTGTTPSRSNLAFYEGGTVPWITSGDLKIDLVTRAKHFVTAEAVRATSLKLYPAGALLLAMYGEGRTRGTVARLGLAATTNQACAVIQPYDPDLTNWIQAVLEASYSSVRGKSAGGVQPNLNLRLVRAIAIPLPPADGRQALLGRVTGCVPELARLDAALDVSLRRSNALRSQVLSAAFSGRLTGRAVDQDLIEEMADA